MGLRELAGVTSPVFGVNNLTRRVGVEIDDGGSLMNSMLMFSPVDASTSRSHRVELASIAVCILVGVPYSRVVGATDVFSELPDPTEARSSSTVQVPALTLCDTEC